MNIDDYFDTVDKKVFKMSDKEFEQLLIDNGLNRCPYEESICSGCDHLINGICRTNEICVEGSLNNNYKS